jgi:hypothetical protein
MAKAAKKPDELEQPEPDERGEAPTANPEPPSEEALAEAAALWRGTLRDIERSVTEATQAIHFLRGALRELAPLLQGIGELEEALLNLAGPGPQQPPSRSQPAPSGAVRPMPDRGAAAPARSQASERREQAARPTPLPAQEPADAAAPMPPPAQRPAEAEPSAPRGLDLLPRTYTITVEDRREEDRRTNVDLAPLHRALMAIEGVRDLSLVSYTHGVAVISLESQSEITTSQLESVVAEAMQRDCTVVARDDCRLHVRVAE